MNLLDKVALTVMGGSGVLYGLLVVMGLIVGRTDEHHGTMLAIYTVGFFIYARLHLRDERNND